MKPFKGFFPDSDVLFGKDTLMLGTAFFDSCPSAHQRQWGQIKSFHHILSCTNFMGFFIFKPFCSLSLFTTSMQCILSIPLYLASCTLLGITVYGIFFGSIQDMCPNHQPSFFCNHVIDCLAVFFSLPLLFCTVLKLSVFPSVSPFLQSIPFVLWLSSYSNILSHTTVLAEQLSHIW